MKLEILLLLGVLITLGVFYGLVWRAVKRGINQSVIGTYLKEKHGIEEIVGDEDPIHKDN